MAYLGITSAVSLFLQLKTDTFTADGVSGTFTRLNSSSAEKETMVFIDGVYQEKTEYSVSGNDIVFTTAPSVGVTVEVNSYN